MNSNLLPYLHVADTRVDVSVDSNHVLNTIDPSTFVSITIDTSLLRCQDLCGIDWMLVELQHNIIFLQ